MSEQNQSGPAGGDLWPGAWMVPAKSKIGQHEVLGGEDNPFIVELLAEVGLPHQHDETAWCSAFVNWCMKQAGIDGTGRANARSWEHWGQALAAPTYGCVAVLWRDDPNGPHGHVAFWVGAGLDGALLLLGGNEGNAVRVREYPKARLLSYRWPVPALPSVA